jgi:hypothetical protein
VSSPKRELIRSVLNTLNAEIVKRARPTSDFNFAAASVGNLFLTGYVLCCFVQYIVSSRAGPGAEGRRSCE